MKKDQIKFLCLLFLIAVFIIPATSFAQNNNSKETIIVRDMDLRNKLFFSKDANIWSLDPATKSQIQITQSNDINNFCVSIDGTQVVAVREFRMYLLDLKTGKEVFLTSLTPDASPPSISPSKDKIVYVSNSEKEFDTSTYFGPKWMEKVRHIWLYDLTTKKSVDLTESSSSSHSAPKWSLDGTKISYAKFAGWWNKDWKVFVREMPRGRTKEISGGFYTEWIDKNTVMVSELMGHFGIFDIKSKKRKDEFYARTRHGYSDITFSPLSRQACFVVITADQEESNIDCYNTESKKTSTVVERAGNPMFSR